MLFSGIFEPSFGGGGGGGGGWEGPDSPGINPVKVSCPYIKSKLTLDIIDDAMKSVICFVNIIPPSQHKIMI